MPFRIRTFLKSIPYMWALYQIVSPMACFRQLLCKGRAKDVLKEDVKSIQIPPYQP